MRITNPSISRNYTFNLNRNLERLSKSNYEVATSGRKIFRMSDDVATGVRAMNVRRSIDQIKGFQDNAKSTQLKFDSAEQTLGGIAEIATKIYERFNFAKNGTNGEDERGIIANEFKKLQEEIVTSANSQYADRYLFGGTNTQSPPFSVNRLGMEVNGVRGKEDFPNGRGAVGDPEYLPPFEPDYDAGYGKIMYNNVLVSEIPGDGKYQYLLDDAAFVDVGLGLSMIGSSQDVNTNTAVKNTINGLSFMGTGSENLYDTVTEIIDLLEGYVEGEGFDQEVADELLNRIFDKAKDVTMERTRLGSESSYLEFTQTRLTDESDNLIARQDSLEFRDPAEAIMEFSMNEYIYNAALNMGSKLLQNSLFDYIR